MADGFLGRWSRRKLDAKEGRPLAPEPEPVRERPPVAEPLPASRGEASPPDAAVDPQPAAPAEPAPTLEDVSSLTPQSDFTRFVRPDVAPDVKNAALKKLFSDPHFNVMDGLDTYIDDYGKPDPLPESMLRQLASSQFLGLFREEERKDEPSVRARDDAEAPPPGSVAQSQPPAAPPPGAPANEVPPHADPDLRLQQDDAAGPGEAGNGTR